MSQDSSVDSAMDTVVDEPGFDPDLSPNHQTNQQAASARGLRYNGGKKAYVDTDGALVADRFGQPF